jgi:hypothetical protein
MHTNRRYMPTKTLYRAAPCPTAAIVQLFAFLHLVYVLLAPKLEVFNPPAGHFLPCNASLVC